MHTPKATLAMPTLLLCSDVQFLGTTRDALNQLQVTPRIVGNSDEAIALLHDHEFDLIVVDWREISNLGDFFVALRRSKQNRDSVVVAIVRDLLDLRQSFAAGVHFLIHKPASVVQVERCLRAAYCATVVRRRKQHRERVNLPASVSTRTQPFGEVLIANLSECGAGLRLCGTELEGSPMSLSAGDEIDVRFCLPGIPGMIHASGRVVWATTNAAGVHFGFIPEHERICFEAWLTECVERSLVELCERLRLCA